MLDEPWDQARYAVRFDWGPTGAARVGGQEGVLVVVDVLSFTTAVGVAVGRGSVVSLPLRLTPRRRDWRATSAASSPLTAVRSRSGIRSRCRRPRFARRPVADRLVLPSPNGAAIAAAAAQPIVVAASLRNAGAVAAWLSNRSRGEAEPITVIAAGEGWPDGSLRPALEDLLAPGRCWRP